MKTIREAILYKKIDDKVKCETCERFCLIPEGKLGFCKTRKNIKGKLFTLEYGDIGNFIEANPIEKKPFFHFYPGSYALTAGTWSCNFTCPWCLDARSMFPMKINGRVKIIHAKDLDTFFKGGNLIDVSNLNLFVRGPYGWLKVLRIYRKKPEGKILEIITKRGKKIFLTPEHKVMVRQPRIVEKKAEELSVGDELFLCNVPVIKATLRQLNILEEMVHKVPKKYLKNMYVRGLRNLLRWLRKKEKCTFVEISKNAGIKHHSYQYSIGRMRIEDFFQIYKKFQLYDKNLDAKIGVRGKKYAIPAILKITPELMRLLGYFVGDGHYEGGYGLGITSACHDRLQDIERCLAYFDTYVSMPKRKGRSSQVCFGGKHLYLLFKFIFEIPAGASRKRFPWLIFNVERKLIKEFFSAYLTCDGTIGSWRKRTSAFVRIVTTSRSMVTDMTYLLRSFQIDFSIVEHKCSSILPTGHRSKLLQYWINITGWKNIKRLQECAVFLDERQITIDNFLNKVRTTKPRGKDNIAKIKEINPTHDFVYDLILEGSDEDWKNHTFFAGDGILVHNCQNWHMSKFPPNPERANYISPEKFVQLVKEENCQGTSISFNEPTLLFEYSLDVFVLAKKQGYYNTYVTNGYTSLKALKLLVEHGLDAMNVDVKGDAEAVRKYCGADVEKIWRNIIQAKKLGLHVEITTLIIPGVNDDEECLRGIAKRIFKIDPSIPWHTTAYYPAYKFTSPPTPIETLEKAWKIGKAEGIKFVYSGNIPGHKYENTYCPNCNELLIQRFGFDVIAYRITEDKKCPNCKEPIPIVGVYIKSF